MRATPAQIAVRHICGLTLPRFVRDPGSLTARIEHGRRSLQMMTDVDFGYDLAAWHNHLKESREGGYTYSRNIVLPKIMQEALANSEWQAAVRNLERAATTRDKSAANVRLTRTPAVQVAVRLLCGKRRFVDSRDQFQSFTLEESIQAGRDRLVKLKGVDFGFDLARWHDHLRETGTHGYTRQKNLPRLMKEALASKAWQDAVESLIAREKAKKQRRT